MVSFIRVFRRILRRSSDYAPYLFAFGVLVLAAWTVWMALLAQPPAYWFRSSMANTWFGYLSPILVAFTFWVPGLVVLAYARPDRQATMLFLFCQGTALTLITGTQSILGSEIGMFAFVACLWWIGPLAIHTQMALTAREESRLNLRALTLVYGTGGLFFLVFLFALIAPESLLHGFRQEIAYSWLAVCLGLTCVLLARRFKLSTDPEVRRNAGIVLWSNVLGFSPMLLLALLPTIFFGGTVIPFQASFFFLVFIPAGYSYAILRYRLVSLQRYVDRSAAYSLIVLIVSGVYGTCYLAFSRLLPNVERLPLLVEMSLAVVLIFAVQPLYRWLLAHVNRSFYGAWYDDRAALMRIGQSLGEAQGDPASVACTLCQVLERTVAVEYARLMLSNGAIVTGRVYVPFDQAPSDRAIEVLRKLQQQTGREMGSKRDLDKLSDLAPAEKAQIFGEKPRLWLLLSGSQDPLGLLVLGPRYGGDYDPDVLETLELLVRQAKTALENSILLARVRADAEQITRLHRQLIQARETERAGLARELHDETIQSLYGINYQISDLKTRLAPDHQHELDRLRSEVSRILDEVRSICSNLRPPALDSLGVVAAAQAHVRKVRKNSGMRILFRLEGSEPPDLPEEVSMALYRVLQESLSNAVKHASADLIQVVMCFAGEISLSVQDNGQGFDVPHSLDKFARWGHYGLAGIQERVEVLGGHLQILAAPGSGCTVSISLPLSHLSPTIPRHQEPLYDHPSLDRR